MGSILNSAAQRLNADTAGRTTAHTEPNPGQPAAATPGEIFHNTVATATGALDSLFRQEPASGPLAPVSTSPVAPGGIEGPHGGRVPGWVSGLLPGNPGGQPGPTTAPAIPSGADLGHLAQGVTKDVVTSAGTARATAAHALATIRRRLGV